MLYVLFSPVLLSKPKFLLTTDEAQAIF